MSVPIDRSMSVTRSFSFADPASRLIDWQIARFLTPRDTPFYQIDKECPKEQTVAAAAAAAAAGGDSDVCAIVLGFQLNRDGSPHMILRYQVQSSLVAMVMVVVTVVG